MLNYTIVPIVKLDVVRCSPWHLRTSFIVTLYTVDIVYILLFLCDVICDSIHYRILVNTCSHYCRYSWHCNVTIAFNHVAYLNAYLHYATSDYYRLQILIVVILRPSCDYRLCVYVSACVSWYSLPYGTFLNLCPFPRSLWDGCHGFSGENQKLKKLRWVSCHTMCDDVRRWWWSRLYWTAVIATLANDSARSIVPPSRQELIG